MKTHFAEEIDDTSQFNETAEEHVWHEHRLTPGSTLGNIAAIVVLVASFFMLLKLSLPPTHPVATLGLTGPAWVEPGTGGLRRNDGLAAGDERERGR